MEDDKREDEMVDETANQDTLMVAHLGDSSKWPDPCSPRAGKSLSAKGARWYSTK